MVGTAIGYYLVRKEEAWPTKLGEGLRPARKVSTERTLAKFRSARLLLALRAGVRPPLDGTISIHSAQGSQVRVPRGS